MRENTAVGMAVIGCRCVIAGLVEFRHELADGQCHGVAQHKRADKRKDGIAQNRVAGAHTCQLCDCRVTYQCDDCIHQNQQHDDGRDNAGYPADKLFAAEGKQIHKT